MRESRSHVSRLRASARGLSLTRGKRTAGTAGRREAKPSRASKRCSALALSFGRRLRTTTSRRGTLRRASGWPSSHRDLGACIGICAHAAGGQIVTAHATAPRKPGGLLTESENAPRRSPVRDPLGAWSSPQPFLRASCASVSIRGRSYFAPRRISRRDTRRCRRHCEFGTGTNPGAQERDGASRAVDGGGQNTGIVTTGFFGSMIFWPLAELESAVQRRSSASSRSSQTRGVRHATARALESGTTALSRLSAWGYSQRRRVFAID